MLVCHGISMLNFKTVTPFKSGIPDIYWPSPLLHFTGPLPWEDFPPLLARPPHLFLAQDQAPGDRLEITEWWFPGRWEESEFLWLLTWGFPDVWLYFQFAKSRCSNWYWFGMCIYIYIFFFFPIPKKNVKSIDICGLQAQRLTVASCVPSCLRQAGAAWVGDNPLNHQGFQVPKMRGIPHLYISCMDIWLM